MKIDFDDNNLIVFLNNKRVEGVDFFDSMQVENYFRNLFLKLNDYGYELSGSYSISVFIDEKCGVILEISENDIEYFDCYDVDMDITISKYKNFIYKLNHFINKIDGNIYCYDGNFYFDPDYNDFISYGLLIENCEIVYGKKCFDIKKMGEKISYCC